MYIATGERSAAANPTARILYEHIARLEGELGLTDDTVFFDFPLYRDDERLVECQFLLVSKTCGLVLAAVSNVQRDVTKALTGVEATLDSAYGQLLSRLIKNPRLRRGRNGLRVDFDAFVYAPDIPPNEVTGSHDFEVVRSAQQLRDFLLERKGDPVADDVFLETLATIEGAKGLLRPKEREISAFAADSKAALVAKLEDEINRFDRDQTEGYLTSVDGVQRIRGLAGSGKTVVLAMRAALLHLKFPESRIAVTFYTKSLYQHVKRLITRFYRQYDDRDPDWEKLNVLHAWGGRSNPGVYYNACLNNGTRPLTYTEALAIGGKDAFDAACSHLLSTTSIHPEYDYVLVDEAQDFPPSFLRLSHALARGGRLVFAYDQLQTIFQTRPPEMTEVFGADDNGEPLVPLSADTVLHKCYRNPLEITICAHALGFGIYGDRIVQTLENEEHWKDLGYEVLSGPFRPGAPTTIRRLPQSSPSSISESSTPTQIVSAEVYSNINEEVMSVAAQIEHCIKTEGLRPDDILVIAADDRHAKNYLRRLSKELFRLKIDANNLHIDAYSLQDFVRDGSVTLSTIHKAKGNEAYQVFIVGIDALFSPVTLRARNMAFTAMTRAKAWLRVSGIGQFAQVFKRELDEALRHCPNLEFRYPTPEDLQVMKRDLRESPEQRAEKLFRELRELLPEEDVRRLVQQHLDLRQANDTTNGDRRGKGRLK